MAIARFTANDSNGSGTGGSLVISWANRTPPLGSLMIVLVFGQGPANDNAVSGFSKLDKDINSNSNDATLFYKISGGSELSFIGATGTGTMQGHLYEYTGTATVSPLETSGTGTSGASAVANSSTFKPSVTTTNAGDLIFSFVANNAANGGTTSWGTSTLLQASTQNRIIAGEYLPGSTQVGFADTGTWATARASSQIVAVFKPPTVSSIRYILSRKPWQ